jgi:putative nucleotidyltransferase with HDIG domain
VTETTLDQVIASVGTLPRLSNTVYRLVSVVSDPRSTLEQIVGAIRYDQTLTAELLRLCNSAYFGLSRTVESVDDAVCLLGTVRVFQLVMAAHARTMLRRPQSGYGLPAGALWWHSVGVAVAAQALARRMDIPQAGVLFTAGLLHDSGKVVLNEYVGREYAEIVRRVTEESSSFSEAEQSVVGYTHAEIGARLAEQWNLPQSIVRCIRHHHEPEAAPEADTLVDAVHLADSIALVLGIGTGDDGLSYRASSTVLARHRLTESDLESVGVETVEELKSVQTLFVNG